MISYYGSKSKVIKYYPKPIHDLIIEPFAGSARYALEYFEKDVILIEKYETLYKIWKYLQQCSPKDILGLPKMKSGETTDDYNFDCIEAKWLMGFMVQQGVNAPRKTVSKVGNFGKCIERDKMRISSSLYKIKHWDIRLGDYRDLKNKKATWFIDPPYQYGGEYYHSSVNNSHLDFKELSKWCKKRRGQTIVCENTKANWMNFKPLKEMHGSKNTTTEAIWYKENNGI